MSAPASRGRFVVPALCAGALVAVVVAAVWQANRKDTPPAAVDVPKPVDRDALARETKARIDELNTLRGSWAGFDRTAPARRALAESDTEARAALIAAEEKWVSQLFDGRVLACEPGIPPPPGELYRDREKMLLALPAVDMSEGRFKEARRELFNAAHREVASFVEDYQKTKHFHRAHGIARKHAVDWNATATLLGPDEVAKLDALRKRCAALANPDVPDPDPDGDPDIAPPPRPKQ